MAIVFACAVDEVPAVLCTMGHQGKALPGAPPEGAAAPGQCSALPWLLCAVLTQTHRNSPKVTLGQPSKARCSSFPCLSSGVLLFSTALWLKWDL